MKHRFKVLMLACAAVCALTAVSAAAAQAGELYVAGQTATGTTTIPSSGGPFVLVSKIGKTSLTIECAEQSASFMVHNGKDPTGQTGLTGTGTVSFDGCSVPPAPACEVPPITTREITIHTKVVGGKEFLIFRPSEGEEFVEVVIEECALEGSFPVKGTTAGYDPNAAEENVSHTLQFSGTIASEAETGLTFGANEATLAGSSTEMMEPAFSVK